MPEIKFTVPGIPVPKGRPRFFGKGHCYTPQKTVSYEAELKYFFLKAVGCLFKPLDCPVQLTMHAFFPMPKSALKKDRVAGHRRKTTKPDLDNIVKAVDGLNGIAWNDDSQIYSILAQKHETTGSPALHVKIEWDTTDETTEQARTVAAHVLAGKHF